MKISGNKNNTACTYKSPVGLITCLFDGDDLVALSIDAAAGASRRPPACPGQSPVMQAFIKELEAYFEGRLRRFRQKTAFNSGTPFEQKVWKALLGIPHGETRTYKWIAEQAGNPKAVRAVGRALGKNPLPIIIPCHRVIGSDGSLTGFSCGIGVKKWLLEHERKG